MSDGPGVEVERVSGVVVARLSGEIDGVDVPDLQSRLRALLGEAAGLVVDLSEVTYFDSAGVRMLDGIVGDCSTASVPLRVAAPEAGRARFVLRICAWREELLAAGVAEAVEDVRGGRGSA